MARILVIDDEESIRTTFSVFLTNEKHDVLMAENVESALRSMNEQSFDLIITDIIMPRISGIDLLKMVNEADPTIPVVIMTGEPTLETATLALRSGAYDYLTKPVSKQQLLTVAGRALQYKKLSDEKKQLEKENEKYRRELEMLLRQRTSSLQASMNTTITTIATIMELRDRYTAEHEKRVANFSADIANSLGLSKRQIDSIYVAGCLHDIGKIAIASEILSKPDKLNHIEFELIKGHVEAGYKILKDLNLPGSIADIVLQHHERLDGSGYPNGLSADDICIEARILMVADVVEAMSSHRPYRPSLGINLAIHEIKQKSGRQYDNSVVDAAVELLIDGAYEFESKMTHVNFEL